jgi:hypothetical protein
VDGSLPPTSATFRIELSNSDGVQRTNNRMSGPEIKGTLHGFRPAEVPFHSRFPIVAEGAPDRGAQDIAHIRAVSHK